MSLWTGLALVDYGRDFLGSSSWAITIENDILLQIH